MNFPTLGIAYKKKSNREFFNDQSLHPARPGDTFFPVYRDAKPARGRGAGRGNCSPKSIIFFSLKSAS